jgi:hypothetical protein
MVAGQFAAGVRRAPRPREVLPVGRGRCWWESTFTAATSEPHPLRFFTEGAVIRFVVTSRFLLRGRIGNGPAVVALLWAFTGCPLSDDYLVDPNLGAGGTTDPSGTGGSSPNGGAAGTDPRADATIADANAGDPGPPGPKPDTGPTPKEGGPMPVMMELAQNKSATASSEQTSKGNLAGLGNDGDSTTRWSAADGMTPKWWRVDLGAPHHISRVEIDWEFARPYGYLIEVSPNDMMYTTLVDRSTSTDATQNQSADVNAMARYVRITVTSVTALPISWPSFFEVRVFGM